MHLPSIVYLRGSHASYAVAVKAVNLETVFVFLQARSQPHGAPIKIAPFICPSVLTAKFDNC
jgi:hypothetical protein